MKGKSVIGFLLVLGRARSRWTLSTANSSISSKASDSFSLISLTEDV